MRRIMYCIFVFLSLFCLSYGTIMYTVMNDNKIYGYDPTDGTMRITITIPVYNGTTTPLLTSIGLQSGASVLWVVDKGTVTYQSVVSYNIATGAISVGAYFPASFQFGGSTWMGSYIDSLGRMYGLIRGCSATCTMFYYRLDNYNTVNGVISPVLVWSVASLASPAWRGLARDEVKGVYYTYPATTNAITVMDSGTGALGATLTNSPTFNLNQCFYFDTVANPNTAVYVFRTSPSNQFVKTIYSSGSQTILGTTFPGGLTPVGCALYGKFL